MNERIECKIRSSFRSLKSYMYKNLLGNLLTSEIQAAFYWGCLGASRYLTAEIKHNKADTG
jgi:hypothetical protein